jgi:hypothetical protein
MAKRNRSKQSRKSHKKGGKSGTGKQTAAYRMFFAEQQAHRSDLNSMSAKEQTKILKDEWKKLSAQQKKAYTAKNSAGRTHNALHKKKTTRKTKRRGAKRHSPSKNKTKRIGQKSAGRKRGHRQQIDQTQSHEAIDNSED